MSIRPKSAKINQPEYPSLTRILMASTIPHGTLVIIATNDPYVIDCVNDISNNAEDIGISGPEENPGVYVWEGTYKYVHNDHVGDGDVEWTGNLRKIRLDEFEELYHLKPVYK